MPILEKVKSPANPVFLKDILFIQFISCDLAWRRYESKIQIKCNFFPIISFLLYHLNISYD